MYIWPRLFPAEIFANLLEGKGSRLDTFTAESISRNRGEFSFVPDLAQCRSNANGSCSFVKFDCFSPSDSFYSASKVVHCPRFKKILERILIFPFHSSFLSSLAKFPLLNIQLARDFILFETCRWNTRNDRGV